MPKGRITLPAEAGQEKTVLELINKWGADAIRDSDGTTLSQELLDLGFEIYSTICIVRANQDYPRKHPNHLPQQFLQSHRVTGNGCEITIDLLQNFYKSKYSINEDDTPAWILPENGGKNLPTGIIATQPNSFVRFARDDWRNRYISRNQTLHRRWANYGWLRKISQRS